MKFFFYTTLNDIFIARNCQNISKQKEQAFSVPPLTVTQSFQKAQSE